MIAYRNNWTKISNLYFITYLYALQEKNALTLDFLFYIVSFVHFYIMFVSTSVVFDICSGLELAQQIFD